MKADAVDLTKFIYACHGYKVEILKMEERKFHNIYHGETFKLLDVYWKNGNNLMIELENDKGQTIRLYEENCEDVQLGLNKDTCALTIFEYDLELLMIHRAKNPINHEEQKI